MDTPGRSLFIIMDTVAETFIGQIIVDRHPAPVCRLFHKLLGDQQTQLAQHPKDYTLLHVGFIEDDGTLTPIAPLTIATGEAWLAANTEASAHGS
ncbi:MAG: nonstructural protein [Arizlama microvirus]|nr:MAG: nonstructural protein [Arizlama microvirus]